jgi:SAM-dependent methyltransferase
MVIGALDTDSQALRTRLALQERLSAFDLNEWIFAHIDVRPGQRWLDLGCGLGKQSIPLSEMGAHVTAVDLSEESLRNLEGRQNIRTLRMSLDDITPALGSFDGVIGSYSLYYASDPERLFGAIHDMLSGQLFFCGPGHGNNLELRELVGRIEPTAPATFMEEAAPAICRKLFGKAEIFRFENAVHFETADELKAYWQSHNLHDPAFEGPFPDRFTNTKRGIGIRARV